MLRRRCYVGVGLAFTPYTAPAITTAPPAWVRPADCGGIGGTCPNGIFDCSSKSMCQLEGYVCVPLAATTSDPRPYCMAYSSMSFDEASCFCTGAAAKQYPKCAAGPGAVLGLCAETGASCASKACCDGLTCMPGTALCQRPCTTNADCPSGCCFDEDDTGHSVCAEASLCTSSCGKVGASCTKPADCCTGPCNTGTNVSDWLGCRRPCTKNTDCSTGCCEMYTSGTSGFCTDARWGGCGTTGTACGSHLTGLLQRPSVLATRQRHHLRVPPPMQVHHRLCRRLLQRQLRRERLRHLLSVA